jgi:pimeloyl-ACP methyl ester carboxylesterase
MIPEIKKEIVVYEWLQSKKKFASPWLVRWEEQLFKIADELVNKGYATVSFDAPGHGKSPGTNSIIVDFIASIKEINKLHGPFEGDWSLVRWNVYIDAIKQGLNVKMQQW